MLIRKKINIKSKTHIFLYLRLTVLQSAYNKIVVVSYCIAIDMDQKHKSQSKKNYVFAFTQNNITEHQITLYISTFWPVPLKILVSSTILTKNLTKTCKSST